MYHYYQIQGGEEHWKPVPAAHLGKVVTKDAPMFVTVCAVSKLVDELSHEEKLKLAYTGPYYVDWDSKDEQLVIDKVNQFLDKLEEMGVDLEMCRLFATGGKGYHCEVPQEVFMDKIPRTGFVGLPAVYREMSMALAVDTLDMRVYSTGRGRMWRQPNVLRSNGRYKVPITVGEMREMTPELQRILTAAPRDPVPVKAPELCIKLSIEFSRCAQKVEDLLKKRAKFKPDPKLREKATSHSIMWMMGGLGIKEGVGFHELALQLSAAAVTAGWTEEKLVEECAGLIASHAGDGDRYNTEAKRREELARMHRYVSGNICYEFSIGGIKKLLSHAAIDLDGIASSKEDVKEAIEEAAAQAPVNEDGKTGDPELDEYGDVAKGVTLAKHGVYMDTEFGKKRICAMGFANAAVLRSCADSQIVGYDCDILVNGKQVARTTLELDVFSGLVPFNRFVAKYGHAFQGTDAQVRTVMMRFVEQAKKQNKISYVVNREGLDMVSIPGHEIPRLTQPFMIWADSHGVLVEPEIQATGVNFKFAGHPDPRGVFRTDISKAPRLAEWIEEPANVKLLAETLRNLVTCQRPEVLGKLLGWYTSCFWKQLFQKHYSKFPLLHVNGPAGLGKTELNIAISSLFFYQNESRPLSPGSTNFAITQHLTSSSSIPLILDEYKPHEMRKERHDAIKMLFRDAYNQRDNARGGGSRESDDFRSLQFTQLAAPLAFIAEAAEDEAAVMERVVLVTLARPSHTQGVKNYTRFQAFQRNHQLLGILGQYLAATVLHDTTPENFVAEFDEMYNAARSAFMLTEADLARGMEDQELQDRQNTKERPVFNHTVAKFGFRKFRTLVKSVLGDVLEEHMQELEDGIYSRLSDLHASTTPEYVKVLKELAAMSYHVDKERPEAMRLGFEYAFVTTSEGRGCVEIAVRTAYTHYRMYCRGASINPLFGSAEAFAHAIQDSPAFIKKGTGVKLVMPGVLTFDTDELARLGVDGFKPS